MNVTLRELPNVVTERFNVNEILCVTPFKDIFYYFFIPLLIALFLFLIMRYKNEIVTKFYAFFSKRGYIKILLQLENKHIKEKIIKLDKYNCFRLGKRRYSLEMMYNFIFGYDKNNFPVFLYDVQFILPLTITKSKITKVVKDSLEKASNDIITNNEISAVSLKLDSNILDTVYDKKLLSDLYEISKSSAFKEKLIWIILIFVGIGIAYYTGILQYVLKFLGIDI